MIRILALGDIVGSRTPDILRERLWKKRQELSCDFVVANGENTTDIHGLSARDATRLSDAGVDLITLGNHAFGMRDIYSFLDDHPDEIIRPANYPAAAPGCGYTIRDVGGWRLLCMNLSGTVYLDALDNPFRTAENILSREAGKFDFSLLDFHAEATSEKLAMGRYFDGRVTILFGTHTHVATADEQVLPGGTGYITDLGMSGPTGGILGTATEAVLTRIRDHLPAHFTVADGPVAFSGALFTLDTVTGHCTEVRRVRF